MFCPDQIICIDLKELRLFAEVIQMIPAGDSSAGTKGDRLWARPLALAQQENFQLHLLHDLREASQLILPSHLFREAFDTEVLPLMTELFQLDALPHKALSTVSRRALHSFIGTLSIGLDSSMTQ